MFEEFMTPLWMGDELVMNSLLLKWPGPSVINSHSSWVHRTFTRRYRQENIWDQETKAEKQEKEKENKWENEKKRLGIAFSR